MSSAFESVITVEGKEVVFRGGHFYVDGAEISHETRINEVESQGEDKIMKQVFLMVSLSFALGTAVVNAISYIFG